MSKITYRIVGHHYYKLSDASRNRNVGQCNSRETGLIKNFDWWCAPTKIWFSVDLQNVRAAQHHIVL